MNQVLSYVLLMPLILWSIFQPALFLNASQVDETINLAIYETQKKASLQGKYDSALYKEMKDYLVNIHHYKADQIKIKGTETVTTRGEKIYIEFEIPQPPLTVIDVFKIDNSKPYKIKRTVRSEYTGTT
ncbi:MULTISPECIES: hypothetical protein [Bacillus]|uniref:DUF3888 domain-containing protein n=9 Tax=Bacillus cereus group TaxID=86661 RepID=A0AAP4QCV8_BACTU|nr:MULTISPECIES: hypothetical protein [Bacillus]EOP80598.1 hypothetical protein IES_06384 [Bacillus cereus BMG1.7]ADU03089.1 hypothetical protein pBMB0558_00115 [Bacillus thuringiensis serovar chinensis CT-43]ADU03170.1 hypothetical protein pBMB0558_00540 [Bacillus thuringiensis serovar chinensis CT-43]AEA19275.1 hypothetical protein CT43_P127093 [Bacillus thuringiensis serovar chinensis CT-43]AGE81607.1 putative exported protein [Bacillus thuringiensis serovar kurstaki str. HD73]